MYLNDLTPSVNVEDKRIWIDPEPLDTAFQLVQSGSPYVSSHPLAAVFLVWGVLAVVSLIVYVAFFTGD